MASPSNLMVFKSPHAAQDPDISGTQSPGSNPFERLKEVDPSNNFECKITQFNGFNTSFKEFHRPSLAPLELNSSDMLSRESLGILPNTALSRDSLTTGLLNISIKETLNTSAPSPRESLGVLNISAMDFGRESIELFNIQNSFSGRKSMGNEIKENFSFNLDDFNFDNIDNGLKSIKKSPLQMENPIPELILSTSSTQDKINFSGLNKAFLFPHSRTLSAISSGSSYSISLNPYFNSRSLEEPSKISPGSSQKDSSQSALATTDPLNQAFQISTGDNNKHSISQILTSTCSKNPFSSDVENMRKRIQSLPVALEDNNIFLDLDVETQASNISFQDAMICRGIEDDKEFDDSVFVEARRVASIIADTSFNTDEKSFDSKEHNILDATPQPEWPTELDSSQNNIEEKKSPRCSQETILKQVDKMLGMQPVNLEEKLKLKNGSKSDGPSLENISQNISKISRTSPGNNAENQSCTSNNFSQNLSKISGTSQEEGNVANQSCAGNNFSENLSKITQTSEGQVSRIIQNLSDILNENENFSETQKKEGHHILQCLADFFSDRKNKSPCSAEDSGHSSVDDQHLEENKCMKNDGKNVEGVPEKVCRALDLSCKGKSCTLEIGKRLSMSKSPASVPVPHLVKTPNRIAMTNTSGTSITSNTSETNKNVNTTNYSNASNCSNASAKSGNISTASRHSNISQNRVSLNAGKLRRSKVGVAATKKGPLRAVLPVENMAKEARNVAKGSEGPVTPERKDGLKFGLSSKRTSTPIQEPKLKPMAASTPANRQPADHAISPLAKPKFTRSFSYQPKASLEPSENNKTTENTLGTAKPAVNKSRAKVDGTKLLRRNSVTEGTLNLQKDIEGKEPKILSALSKVRQNILNSPYYNPKKASGTGQSDVLTENVRKIGTDVKGCGQELKKLSMVSQPKKLGKENFKP